VLHLRPLGQLSVSIFVRFSFQKFAQKFVGEKTGETAKNIRF
jgi:L-asparagine transporter-like permease